MEDDGIKGKVDGPETEMGKETESCLNNSEDIEMHINFILEKIDRFTQQVSETLETGKTMFQELSVKFEEHLIEIHTEQMEKWQEEIKELRVRDASNEETSSLLQNTRSHLFQNCHMKP
ncbi:hypothetical protein ZOSMA_156G00040 [Zostera marina]|uniref:Knotted 1-binding protein n=1 Tax=Zostera marina TaxID=29655 RepID=A0A0K9PVB9_ZOSMR|nr:hypothetical protein ZOSMA_156G00040 [Zostera marina]